MSADASPLFGESVIDDLGHPVAMARPAARVVSLVPSLTEAIAATRPGALVGATDWCTHPADLDVPRVRGTKNPDRAAIAALAPDLVIANQEENRKLDVDRLREAGVPVWVTRIETLDDSFAAMRRMFEIALGWPIPDWLTEAEASWAVPATGPRRRVIVPIWRDPWMVVGSRTYTGDLLDRLGLDHVLANHPDRYPTLDLAEIDRADIDVVLLPDEPYVFTTDDGPEAFRHTRTALVSGRALTWYGPAQLTARAAILDALG